MRALFCLHFFVCLLYFFYGVLRFSGHVSRGVLCQAAASHSQAGNILVPPYPEWGVLTHPHPPSRTLYFRQMSAEEKLD